MCTYHNHFDHEAPLKQLRSLTRANIEYGQKEKLAIGTPLNKTSRNYLFGMVHKNPGMIYAQRGYRQYGTIAVISKGTNFPGF